VKSVFASPAGNRGFSLLEAVVALAIVGLASVAALAAFGAELRTSDRARRALEANALAEERLAQLRLVPRRELDPLADSLRQGAFSPPFAEYRWEASSRSVRGRDDLFDLTVAVRWPEGAYTEATRVYRPQPQVTAP
jgi:prepilin-type N-terminal cleavage/methylation domain-containing protein